MRSFYFYLGCIVVGGLFFGFARWLGNDYLFFAGYTVLQFVGLGTGYLTLRLRGAFFAIATLALAVVLQTLIVNWDFVGGSRGAYIIRPNTISLAGWVIPYIEYLFLLMLLLTLVAII